MDIQFNPQDKDFNAPSYEPTRKSSKMVGWVVKLSGGTISESQANYVLIGLAGVFLGLTLFIIFGNRNSPSVQSTVTPGQIPSPQERFNRARNTQ